MRDEKHLREKAKAAIRSSRLPRERPHRIWGGQGGRDACAVCELRVTPEQLEFEIEFDSTGNNPGLDKYHLHIRCFAAWEFERRNGGMDDSK